MHNAGFAALGLNAVYVPLEAADADDFVAFARALGRARREHHRAVQGRRCSAKVDEVDRAGRSASARSTRSWCATGGGSARTPTSMDSSRRSRAGCALKGARATVLGAGGAARAVAVALADAGRGGHDLRARGRTRRASSRRSRMGAVGTWPPRPGSWDVLVNATSCGSRRAAASPMAGVPLDGEIVFDLVYAPAETPLLARRARRGLPDDRRPRDAGRAGGAAVRAVDRPAAAGGSLPGGGRRRAGRRRETRHGRDADRGLQREADDVRRVRGAGAAAARSCRSSRRSSPTC